MDREFDTIIEEALALDTSHRGELVEKLIVSLEEVNDSDLLDAWLDECERRSKQLETGEAITYPAEAVIREARERIRSK